jgi:hypothetical protein
MNDKDILPKRKAPIAPKQVFVPVKSGRVQQTDVPVVTHNAANNENNNSINPIIDVEESRSKSSQLNMVDKGDQATSINNEILLSEAQMGNIQLEPVLSPLSPRTIQIQQDNLLEKELNEGMVSESDDSSSQGSIVKDSQDVDNRNKAIVVVSMPDFALQNVDMAIHEVVGASSQPIQPADRVLKDMAFLKESWANMVEADEGTHEIEKDQVEGNADGFQI